MLTPTNKKTRDKTGAKAPKVIPHFPNQSRPSKKPYGHGQMLRQKVF